MKRQRNISHEEIRKIKRKNPNETEISNLPDKEIKEMVVRCPPNLRVSGIASLGENFYKELENIIKNQASK